MSKTYPIILYPGFIRDFVAEEKSRKARIAPKQEIRQRQALRSTVSRSSSVPPWCQKWIALANWVGKNETNQVVFAHILFLLNFSVSVIFLDFPFSFEVFISIFIRVTSVSVLLSFVFFGVGLGMSHYYQRMNETNRDDDVVDVVPMPITTELDQEERLARLFSSLQPIKPQAVSTAHKGVNEQDFFKVLRQYFQVQWGGEFPIPGSQYRYSADIQLIHITGLSIDIEIDEPYESRSGQPHHCVDDGKDNRRNEFFLGGNWLVVRFAEIQVVKYPYECAAIIGQVLADITGNNSYLLPVHRPLPPVKLWTIAEAKKMARSQFRNQYLPGWGKKPLRHKA